MVSNNAIPSCVRTRAGVSANGISCLAEEPLRVELPARERAERGLAMPIVLPNGVFARAGTPLEEEPGSNRWPRPFTAAPLTIWAPEPAPLILILRLPED